MRILLINQCFFPDVAATAQHGWDLAEHLRDKGHEVTAITSRSLYGGSGATLPAIEIVRGIRIIRVGSSRFGKRSLPGRVADFARFFLLATIRATMLPRQDVCVCFTTPPFLTIIGLALRGLKGTRCVTWLMDAYPDVPVALGLIREGSSIHRILDRLSRSLLTRSDTTVVLGQCMERRLNQRGVSPECVVRISPWASDSAPAPETRHAAANPFRLRWNAREDVLFMYSGNFGLGHDFDSLIAATRAGAFSGRCRLALVGDGKKKGALLECLCQELRAGRVIAEPYQPRDKVPDLLAAADVHLVSLALGCEGTMVPSKFFGVLAAGRPVIYIGHESGEAARIIREVNCGIVVRPDDNASLLDALARLGSQPTLRAELGENARRASNGAYSREKALNQWSSLIESVVPRRTGS